MKSLLMIVALVVAGCGGSDSLVSCLHECEPDRPECHETCRDDCADECVNDCDVCKEPYKQCRIDCADDFDCENKCSKCFYACLSGIEGCVDECESECY